MKWLAIIVLLLLFAGCASFRAKIWAAGSEWADGLDGSDDVPSVEFNQESK